MTLDEKIQILDKLRGGMSAGAVGPTFRWYTRVSQMKNVKLR
jgi:hypothetical protein